MTVSSTYGIDHYLLFYGYDLCSLLMRWDNICFDIQKRKKKKIKKRKKKQLFSHYGAILATSMENKNCPLKKTLPTGDTLNVKLDTNIL